MSVCVCVCVFKCVHVHVYMHGVHNLKFSLMQLLHQILTLTYYAQNLRTELELD